MQRRMSSRIHRFEAVENFRDYGDYATAAGRRLAAGRLLRSAHYARATDADLRKLLDLGVGVIVDLRHPHERLRQPSRRPAGWAGTVIESDICQDENGEPPHVTFLRTTDLSEASVTRYMTDAYRRIPFEARHLDLFRRYFEALAEGDGAVVIHCAAGKDRTGLLAALTHHLAGVSRDDLVEDYLLTNTAVDMAARGPEVARRLEELYGKRATPAAVEAFLGVRPEFLETAFAEIAARYGSLDGYLAEAVGIGAALRDRVAMRLLGEA